MSKYFLLFSFVSLSALLQTLAQQSKSQKFLISFSMIDHGSGEAILLVDGQTTTGDSLYGLMLTPQEHFGLLNGAIFNIMSVPISTYAKFIFWIMFFV